MKRTERREGARFRRLLEEHGEAAEEPEKERGPPAARRRPLFLIRRNLTLSFVLFEPPPRDQRPGDEERRDMRDRPVAVEKKIMEDERAVHAVEDTRRQGTPER